MQHLQSLLYEDTFRNMNHKLVVSPSLYDTADSYNDRVIKITKMIHKLQIKKSFYKIDRQVTLFFDEIQYLMRNKEFEELATDIALMGRNKKLFAVFISQRAQNIDKSLFTQTNAIVGKLHPFDVKYFENLHISLPKLEKQEFMFQEIATGSERKLFMLDVNKQEATV
jgi:phage-related holin